MDTLDNLPTDPQADADLQAVLDRVLAGKPPDAEVARRVQARADSIRQEILARHGMLNAAVDLIREGRDEE